MRKILALIAGFLATASLFTSCLETEDVVLSGNAYIVSFSINNIETEMANVIAEDLEIVNKMKSTFMPGKKIAAISAAVGSYQNQAMAHMAKK